METKQNTKSNEPLSGKLSFAKLIEFWEKESSQDNFIKAAYIPLKEKLANAPELYSPIEDESILEKHRELIDQLLAICIPPALRKFDYFAAVHPDMNRSIYETPAFKKLGVLRVLAVKIWIRGFSSFLFLMPRKQYNAPLCGV